jgi:WD40 repeat protein
LVRALGKARFTLLVTLRADFYSQIITLDRELSDRLAPAQVNIGALTRDEMRESIIRPAKLVGLEFEPGLVERILHDVGCEPGSLPLLEYALAGLWSKRQNRTLTNAAYDEIGGVTEAIAQRAEGVFAHFGPEEQTATRRLLSRLVRLARPEEGAEDTRQRAELEDDDPVTQKVALVLAGADVRLLIMGHPESAGHSGRQTVEVAHEALIRSWGRLRSWLNEDRPFLLWQQRTRVQVDQWEKHGRDASYLLRGLPLSEAERWLVGQPKDLIAADQQFINESKALREQEREAEGRRRDLALALQLAADSERLRNRSSDRALATLLAIESLRRQKTVQGYEALWHASSGMGREVARLEHQNVVRHVAFSPDGTLLATGSDGNTVRVFEPRSGREPVRLSSTPMEVNKPGAAKLAFNRDGTLVAFGSDVARLFDARTGREVTYLGDTSVQALAFSPDGSLIASGTNYCSPRVWKTRSGRQVAGLSHERPVSNMAFRPDGRLVATASEDKTAGVFEARTWRELSRLADGDAVIAVAFSPDGNVVATASKDGTARVFEVRTGREVSRLAHGGPVVGVAFGPDGVLVATASWDKTARVFEARTGREVSRLARGDAVRAVAFSPDGVLVATASEDKTARVFEAGTGWEVSRLAHGSTVSAVAFSRDGVLVATASWDKTERVFEARTDREVAWLAPERLRRIAFSADGALVATATEDKTTQVFEARTGREISRLVQESLMAFSLDGMLVATASSDNSVRVFEAHTGREVARLPLPPSNSGSAAAFSPDGTLVAIGLMEMTLVFEARTGRELARHELHGGLFYCHSVGAVSFSPDGAFVVIASSDSAAVVFEARTGRDLSRLAHGDAVIAVAFSPDGVLVATASEDKTARVFETRTGREIARLPFGQSIRSLSFASPGCFLRALTGETNFHITQDPVCASDLVTAACSRLDRNLTREEWASYLGALPYRETCQQLSPAIARKHE